MLNSVYQLISPKIISIKYQDISFDDEVLVRPDYLALCHADQRYYQGKRDAKVLRKKLPMALIHEGCGTVLYDPTHTFQPGEKVIMIPNVLSTDRGCNFRKLSKRLCFFKQWTRWIYAGVC